MVISYRDLNSNTAEADVFERRLRDIDPKIRRAKSSPQLPDVFRAARTNLVSPVLPQCSKPKVHSSGYMLHLKPTSSMCESVSCLGLEMTGAVRPRTKWLLEFLRSV